MRISYTVSQNTEDTIRALQMTPKPTDVRAPRGHTVSRLHENISCSLSKKIYRTGDLRASSLFLHIQPKYSCNIIFTSFFFFFFGGGRQLHTGQFQRSMGWRFVRQVVFIWVAMLYFIHLFACIFYYTNGEFFCHGKIGSLFSEKSQLRLSLATQRSDQSSLDLIIITRNQRYGTYQEKQMYIY